MKTIEEKIEWIEEEEKVQYISATEVKLSKSVKALIKQGLEEKREFFVFTYQDHDESVELKIDDKEYILLFRQEGHVVTAKSIYLYENDGDEERIKNFLESF